MSFPKPPTLYRSCMACGVPSIFLYITKMEQGGQKMLVLEWCADQLTYVKRHNKITGENRYWAFCTEDEADLFIQMDDAEMNGMIYCDEDIIYEYSYVNEDEEAVLYD